MRLLLDREFEIVLVIGLMVTMGVASLVPVLPLMPKMYGVDASRVGLVVTVFSLPAVVLSPISGVLADRFGRKPVLLPSLFVFGFFGGMCFFTRDFETLLLYRFLQGVGLGPLTVVANTIIGDLYSGPRLTSAVASMAAVQTLAVSVFPYLGGALASADPFAPYLLALGGLPVCALAWWGLRLPGTDRPKPRAPAPGAFVGRAFRQLANLRMLTLLGVTFLIFFVLFGASMTYLPLLLAVRFHASALEVGLFITGFSLVTPLVALRLAWLEAALGMRALVLASLLLYACAFLLFPFMPGLWWGLVPGLMLGLARGLSLPTTMTIVQRLAPEQDRAVFNAAYATALRLGQTAGPAAMGLVFAAGRGLWGREAGLNAVFFTASGCSALALGGLLALAVHVRRAQARNGTPAGGDS